MRACRSSSSITAASWAVRWGSRARTRLVTAITPACTALRGAGRTHAYLGKGAVVYQDAVHLHGPLGLIFAPNGNLLVANADPAVSPDATEPSEIVEFTRSGRFVRQYSVDPNLGSAFALGIVEHDDSQVFAYVDDFLSTCTILNLSPGPF